MKEQKRKIFLFLILVLGMAACGFGKSDVEDFKETFSLKTEKEEIKLTECYNDHGGLQNDGVILYKITANDKLKAEIKEWNQFPYTDEVNEELQNDDVKNAGLPEVKNGKWKLVDKGKESMMNYSLCIYDQDNDIFYYLKVDY
ncbi:MAG: hypothetical protein ACI4HI_01670 [Lachnospiraceae bacterium]